MQVEAIRDGYYNHRRVYKGQVFAIFKDTDFSDTWMKRIDGEAVPTPASHAGNEPVGPVHIEEPASDEVI